MIPDPGNPTDPTDEAVAGALAPLVAILAADDFGLAIGRDGAYDVTLTVTAGPTACPTCLVPETITRRMAEQHLNSLARRPWSVRVAYPADEAGDTAGDTAGGGAAQV